MNGLNKVNLIGNVCADGELRFTQSGTPVLNFRVAVNTRYKSEDEWKERAEFVNLVLWGKRGEALSKILTKGTPVFIDGELRSSSWEDKEDGKKRYKTEVNVNDVILLGGKRGSDNVSDDGGSPGVAPDSSGGDDIPF